MFRPVTRDRKAGGGTRTLTPPLPGSRAEAVPPAPEAGPAGPGRDHGESHRQGGEDRTSMRTVRSRESIDQQRIRQFRESVRIRTFPDRRCRAPGAHVARRAGHRQRRSLGDCVARHLCRAGQLLQGRSDWGRQTAAPGGSRLLANPAWDVICGAFMGPGSQTMVVSLASGGRRSRSKAGRSSAGRRRVAGRHAAR